MYKSSEPVYSQQQLQQHTMQWAFTESLLYSNRVSPLDVDTVAASCYNV